MIAFLDTSALVERYVAEEGTDEVLALWSRAELVAVSRLAYAESVAAMRRKAREQPGDAGPIDRALARFRREWRGFAVVELSESLRSGRDRLLATHPLRGADAAQLSSALLLERELGRSLTFGCWDEDLPSAA